jgi:hypothetical protein
MGPNRRAQGREQPAAGTTAGGGATPAPWYGSGLIAFDARPFARSLLCWYAGAALVGYCAVIAWAQSLHSAWLVWWLDLWAPVVDVLRPVLPIFNRFDRALTAKGFADRAPVIDHLIAVGWLITIPTFAFLTWTMWRLSHEELVRFVTKVPSHRLAIMFFGFALFFIWGLVWITFGFKLTTENPMFAVHRYNWALPVIGIYFSAVIMFGIGFQTSLRGLIVYDGLHPQ